MRRSVIIIALFVLFFCWKTNAQLTFNETNNGGMVQLADQMGISLVKENYDPGIEGTAYVNADWNRADLFLAGGRQFSNVKVKLNIENNDLLYQDSAGNIRKVKPGVVKKIQFASLFSNDGMQYIFQNGYPAADKQTPFFYYQLIEEGKIGIVKKLYKTVETFRNDLSGEVRKEFVERNWYYVYAGGNLTSLKYERDFFTGLMKDKQADIEKYLDSNKINFKKTADLRKLVSHYNSLK